MDETPFELSRRETLIVVAGLMVGLSLSALDGTIVATALPTIVGDLGGLEQLSWVVTSYLLASTAATPLFGKLSDLYGRRRLFQVAIVIFIVGSMLAGVSQDHAPADPDPRAAGHRRRRRHGDVLLDHRRRHPGPRARAVHGLLHRDVRRGQRRRAVARRVLRRRRWTGGGSSTSTSRSGSSPWSSPRSVLRRVPFHRQEHRIDFLGAALMVAAVSSTMLVAVWGGAEYAWSSGVILGLGARGGRA